LTACRIGNRRSSSTSGLARRLIGGQFPELELASLRLIGEGWDNSVWLVDERWAFRFPRRTMAIPGVEREIAVLPALAPLLPLPIPAPVYAGRPADGYPWPFFGAAHLPGVEVADAALTDDARTRLAPECAGFLRALHAPAVAAAVHGQPADPMRRGDVAFRVPKTVEGLAELERAGLWPAPEPVRRLLEDARGLPPPEPTVVAHGDLHFRHLLVDERGGLTGVIDWGDLCRGDPSIDLMMIWSLFGPEGRAAFLAAYGPVNDEQLLRARVLAIFVCAVLALYAHHEALPAVERKALGGLERAAAGLA
jgi:aminoglycoside phosphotransferase (APT) family kinase protein